MKDGTGLNRYYSGIVGLADEWSEMVSGRTSEETKGDLSIIHYTVYVITIRLAVYRAVYVEI